MISVALVGATGYGGIELVRLLHAHPHARLTYLTSETYAGKQIGEVYPHLAGLDLPLTPLDPAKAAACDVALLALPAGKSMEIVPALLAGGARVVDISPDFRLKDPAVYEQWYKLPQACPELLGETVFGLPELYREAIAAARIAAAPGCYTTAALLALAPLVAGGIIQSDDIIADGKTGLSGAGRTSLKLEYHFPEADEDACAYAVGGHRHLAEITQELGALADGRTRITFVPHLVPMSRGLLMTCYVRPGRGVTVADLHACLEERYTGEPFVHVLPAGVWPHTKWTVGTNHCFLGTGMDDQAGRAVIVSAIDNLGKGMAGQMVQCLNLMLGIEETTGLSLTAAYP